MSSVLPADRPSVSSEASASEPLHAEVLALFDRMYGGYLEGDSGRIDSLLAPEFTMFDSAARELVVGFEELASLRAARGPRNPDIVESALIVDELRVFERDQDVLACFMLEVRMSDAIGTPLESERSRTTAWLARRGGALVIRHLHEDVYQVGGAPIS
ncbi:MULTISPECIES: hypothetical protein [unclassified Plantibacter]|jgi:hypothetical protein|uniref:hypothetical protein n=1 Tax=unclassified Plantibacter TaxID=2624265 RepID=UPI003D34FF40